MPRTEETEFGLLLKTPCAADAHTENLSKKEQVFGNSGTLAQEVQTGFIYQITADTESTGGKGKRIQRQRKIQFDRRNRSAIPTNWQEFPTESPICGGDDGLSRELDGITFSKWRNESIKAYGNAVVPQVVFQIFKAIEIIEDQK